MKYREIPSAGDWLKAKDNMDFASEVVITDVTDEQCSDFDTGEPITKVGVHVDHQDLIGIILLNPTNERALQAKWQDTENMDDWIGRKVFLSTRQWAQAQPGWTVVPLEYIAATKQVEMEFDDDIPFGEPETKKQKKARKKAEKAKKAA